MNPEDRTRVAAGESEELPPAPTTASDAPQDKVDLPAPPPDADFSADLG